jgi:transposase
LEAAGIKVVLDNPTKTRMIAESAINTDEVDARTLADLLRADLILSCYVPSPEVRALKTLVRYRTKLVKALTRIKNRIHSHLDKYELPPCEYKDKFGKGGLQWLEMILSFLDPEAQFIVEMEQGYYRFRKIVLKFKKLVKKFKQKEKKREITMNVGYSLSILI